MTVMNVIVALMLGMFALGLKFAIDLIRERPRKKSLYPK